MSFRSWCEDCVKSRARDAHHRRKAPEDPLDEVKVPRVHMDYFFMSREDESASSNPLFVMADEKSGARYARAVGKKGLGVSDEMDWLIQDISKTLKSWGHAGRTGGHLILKSDGEPALLALKNAVMQYHGWGLHTGAASSGRKGGERPHRRGRQDDESTSARFYRK